MLDIVSGSGSPMCDRRTRRDFLRVGALGLGGLTLADLLRAGDRSPAAQGLLKGKSVILLFLGGGPSQYETFDPKPDGIENFTGINGHIQTSLPDVRFGADLPKIAKYAHRLSVVRSFQTNHSEHDGAHKQIITADLTVKDGKPPTQPGISPIFARVAGALHPESGMFRHAIIPSTDRYIPGVSGFSGSYDGVVQGSQAAMLGETYAPFDVRVEMPSGTGGNGKQKSKKDEAVNPLLDNLEPRVSAMQIDGRLDLLKQLDNLDRRMDSTKVMDGMDQYGRQALELMRSGAVRKALDLNLEDRTTFKSYDTEQFRNWSVDDNSKFKRELPSIGISLGRQLLLARRLCEAGCGFVTVVHANWDFHARKGVPNVPEGTSVLAPPFDHAVAAFLEDVKQRGLEDKILLAITGEFGRSGLDKNAGRHHHPKICPLVFAGGGLKHGRIVGQSNPKGSEPATTPYTIDDFQSTIFHTLLDVNRVRLDTELPPVVLDRIGRGKPIAEMF